MNPLFLNIASFVLSGLICHNINHSGGSGMLPGKMHYLIRTFRSLASYQPVPIRLQVDDNMIEEDINETEMAAVSERPTTVWHLDQWIIF